MSKIINYPYLTAIVRKKMSFPSNLLKERGLLNGCVLDFGCGHGKDTEELRTLGYDVTPYDNYYVPAYPEGRFDTIICNYVLNVLEPYEQADVLMRVSELLRPGGVAYYAVRRDLKTEGFRKHISSDKHTYQCNVILPYKSIFRNASCEIYEYRHYNCLEHNGVPNCPFCGLSSQVELICETATAIAFFDGFPVSQGHTLIVPKRHVASYFELTNHEQQALWAVVNHCKMILQERFHPDGFNVGINVGADAGQSVFHVHIHLIPRYHGDVENPKGGVRGVIPEKQKY